MSSIKKKSAQRREQRKRKREEQLTSPSPAPPADPMAFAMEQNARASRDAARASSDAVKMDGCKTLLAVQEKDFNEYKNVLRQIMVLSGVVTASPVMPVSPVMPAPETPGRTAEPRRLHMNSE